MGYATYSKVNKEPSDTERSSSDEIRFSEDEGNLLLRQRSEGLAAKISRVGKGCWLAISAALWLLSLSLTWKIATAASKPRYDISLGLDTELEPLKSQIEIQMVTYTGDLNWNQNGTLVRTTEPGRSQVAPQTSEAMKQRRLREPRFSDRMDDYCGYDEKDMATYNTHVEHCVDSIRQALMCTSDITAYLIDWNNKYRRPRPDFATKVHTCRKFEKIRDWAVEHDADNHPVWRITADGKKLGSGL
ncbi:hypothetical protein F5B21DRAFT_525465 [Xylaria acuta]|nr:hypothetical protein F5B21DRAFT_525465 [Xylaria acuta]